VFASLGDNALYRLGPEGTFEAGAPGWSLAQAEVISANVPQTGSLHALAIKPRGRVVSPSFCVSSDDPTFRFLYRRLKGGGKLNVGVSWTDASGGHEAVVATLPTYPAWTPSPVLQLASVLPLSEPGSSLDTVRLVFTASHPGLSVAIADVYIDPYRR
jgi:hypothetical protein